MTDAELTPEQLAEIDRRETHLANNEIEDWEASTAQDINEAATVGSVVRGRTMNVVIRMIVDYVTSNPGHWIPIQDVVTAIYGRSFSEASREHALVRQGAARLKWVEPYHVVTSPVIDIQFTDHGVFDAIRFQSMRGFDLYDDAQA